MTMRFLAKFQQMFRNSDTGLFHVRQIEVDASTPMEAQSLAKLDAREHADLFRKEKFQGVSYLSGHEVFFEDKS